MAASTGRRSTATTKPRPSAKARTAEPTGATASRTESAGGTSASGATQTPPPGVAGMGAMPGLNMPGFDASAFGAMGDWLKPDAWSRLWQGQGAAAAMPTFDALKQGLPTSGFDPQAGAALGQGMFSSLQSLAGLSVPSDALGKIQQDYMQQAASLWNTALEKPAEFGKMAGGPSLGRASRGAR